MKRTLLVVVLCLAGLVAIGGWWWASQPPLWNVVLITLDTTRADHLGCYGRDGAVTPNLDRFAADSVLFERAYTVVPITLPAHATMLTGLLPPEHGLRINGTNRLVDAIPTLPEMLQQRGYRTGAFVSSLVLDSRFGLARGFEAYDDLLGSGPDGPQVERSAEKSVSAAVAWMNGVFEQPFFCWVHLYDPHEPYDAHSDEFGDQFADSPYDGEIAYMDRHIGRVLDALAKLGVDNRTIIVVAGDHGEGLGEHGEATHGYLTYNSTMHVPLMVRHPEWSGRGKRIGDPVSLVDVFPTIMDGLEFETPENLSGRSLQPICENQPADPRACYGESEAPLMEGGWCPLRSWTTDRWKLIQSTQPELYDLATDPDETSNVIDEFPHEAAQLGAELAEFEAKLPSGQGSNAVLSEQEQRALASLGYSGGHFVEHADGTPRRDIKETLDYAERVHECMHLIDRNELAESQSILEGVVAALPEYSKAWGTLGVCLAKQNEPIQAEEHFRTALELDINQNFARIGLGRALFAQDRFEECVEQLEEATAREPSALDAQYYLAEAYRELGRTDKARRAYRAALEISPHFEPAQTGLQELSRDESEERSKPHTSPDSADQPPTPDREPE